MIQRWLREAGEFLRDTYDVAVFNRPNKFRRYRGVYSSFAAAQAAMPAGQIHGFDHGSVADFFVDTHFVFNPSDYSVLFWLSQLLDGTRTICDFGGGVGQCYYLYKHYLPALENVEWTVCEVEAMVERGKELARESGLPALRFTTRFEDTSGCDILFTAGALHYLDQDLPDLLAKHSELPKHILINRVPLYEGEKFYTVQKGEHSYVAHKVMNLKDFIEGIERLGYRKVDQWYLQRSIRIPLHRDRTVQFYWGFYFQREE